MRAALHRLRSARAGYANYTLPKPKPNPKLLSSNVIGGQQLRIHGYLSTLNILRLSAWCCPTQRCHLSSSPSAAEGSPSANSSSSETISVTFVDKHGDEKPVNVPLGMSMLEAAHQNDIELEGACEGSLACSTCHVIVMDGKYYSKLPEPTDEENDMLDLAFGLTETSRLGCQVLAKPELEGMRLAIPSATRNFAVDGYVPKPH